MSAYRLGTELSDKARREALARFVHRMTVENASERPGLVQRMMLGGYALRLLTDAEWLACTRFAVRKDGHLSNGVHYCLTHHPDWVSSRSDSALDAGRMALAASNSKP